MSIRTPAAIGWLVGPVGENTSQRSVQLLFKVIDTVTDLVEG